jgi:hypothetical protein
MKKIFLAALVIVIALSCERVKEKAGSAIDSGAQAVGKTASDVANNIEKGISEGAKIDIQLSEDLKKQGLSFGKYYVRNDEAGNENILSLYLISDNDIDAELQAKLFDKKDVEMGRTAVKIKQKKDGAAYYDFVFDPKISFEYQSKLIIE